MKEMDENEIYQICEAIILRDSLNLYMTRLAEQHRAHPDFEATMRFCGQIYKKYSRIASQQVVKDQIGHYTLRRNMRTDFDLN